MTTTITTKMMVVLVLSLWPKHVVTYNEFIYYNL